MSKVKKVITDITEAGVEAVKDSAKQIAKTVSPNELLKQATGQQRNEFTEYLKSLGSNASQEQLKQKEEELKDNAEKGMEESRKVIRSATPAHMRRSQTPPTPRPGEVRVQEEERKKAQQVEAQKIQPLVVPTGQRKSPRLPGAEKPKGTEGMLKDTRTG